MRKTHRPEKLAHGMIRVLNEVLAYDAADDALSNITVLRVELSGDNRSANVFYSVLGDPDAAQAALERAEGFLRARMALEMGLRHTPRLTFMLEEDQWKDS